MKYWGQISTGIDFGRAGRVRGVQGGLTVPISDYPGMHSLLGKFLPQAPTRYACPCTWHRGVHAVPGKTVYDPHTK